jgi:putative SOS response-associated peptidase YedK
MCGRFTLRAPVQTLASLFDFADGPALEPRYNIAPTQPVAAVRSGTQGRELVLLRWGLIPSWASDPSIGNRLINARAETVAEKPAFRAAFRHRRCLVLTDGFYEWRKEGKRKQPYFIGLKSGQPFAFAGLWEHWNDLETCTVLTTAANELMRPLHERMPLILPEEAHDLWLDPEVKQADLLKGLLQPFPSEEMIAYPVSVLVNNPRHEDPRCVERSEGNGT